MLQGRRSPCMIGGLCECRNCTARAISFANRTHCCAVGFDILRCSSKVRSPSSNANHTSSMIGSKAVATNEIRLGCSDLSSLLKQHEITLENLLPFHSERTLTPISAFHDLHRPGLEICFQDLQVTLQRYVSTLQEQEHRLVLATLLYKPLQNFPHRQVQ